MGGAMDRSSGHQLIIQDRREPRARLGSDSHDEFGEAQGRGDIVLLVRSNW